MNMMLRYVHNTTKIRRIWDVNSGSNGQAVEWSRMIFREEENVHGKSTKERIETIEFPEIAGELHDEIHKWKK
jgi:hypothetical protein